MVASACMHTVYYSITITDNIFRSRVIVTTLVNTFLSISHNSNYKLRDIRSTCITATFVNRILQPTHPSIPPSGCLPEPSLTSASVSLKFSLVDNPRTQIEKWFEDVSTKARGLCVQ
jgi:hypothetical protein